MTHIPPVVQLLLSEDWHDLSSLNEFARKYKKLAKEISAQAEWTVENFDYLNKSSSNVGQLTIAASGGLNPFSLHGICAEQACRLKTTREIARTLGLYGDVIAVPDGLSYTLASLDKPTASQLYWISTQILILKELQPLIEAGIVQFWSNSLALCTDCLEKAERRIEIAVSELCENIDEHISAELNGNYLYVKRHDLLENSFFMEYELTESIKEELSSGASLLDLARTLYRASIKDHVRTTLFELSFSQSASALMMSTSRTQLYALRSIDEAAPALSELAIWERARSVQLPWVNTLSTNQIVQLRESAKSALPAFRETFVRHLARPNADVTSVGDKIAELRESAADVERELEALNPSGEKAFRNIAGALGITVSVYGFASGAVPAGVALGGLMSLLGLLHASGRNDHEREALLKSQPGYVLLKARELAEHATSDKKA